MSTEGIIVVISRRAVAYDCASPGIVLGYARLLLNHTSERIRRPGSKAQLPPQAVYLEEKNDRRGIEADTKWEVFTPIQASRAGKGWKLPLMRWLPQKPDMKTIEYEFALLIIDLEREAVVVRPEILCAQAHRLSEPDEVADRMLPHLNEYWSSL